MGINELKAAVLYTGGKDSSFSLYWALLQGFDVRVLLSIIPSYDYSMLYHRPLEKLLLLQSRCLGLPILFKYVYNEKYELQVLKELLAEARNKYNVEAVFTGALLSDFQRIRFSMILEETGLKGYNPLWRINQEKYLLTLVREGFEVVIISISTYGLPPRFLGRVLTKEDVHEIIRLSRRYGFNPAFEGGEAETFVSYMPFYKYRILLSGDIIRRGTYEYIYSIRDARIAPL
jgi:diphthine-ammonia ligase